MWIRGLPSRKQGKRGFREYSSKEYLPRHPELPLLQIYPPARPKIDGMTQRVYFPDQAVLSRPLPPIWGLTHWMELSERTRRPSRRLCGGGLGFPAAPAAAEGRREPYLKIPCPLRRRRLQTRLWDRKIRRCSSADCQSDFRSAASSRERLVPPGRGISAFCSHPQSLNQPRYVASAFCTRCFKFHFARVAMHFGSPSLCPLNSQHPRPVDLAFQYRLVVRRACSPANP